MLKIRESCPGHPIRQGEWVNRLQLCWQCDMQKATLCSDNTGPTVASTCKRAAPQNVLTPIQHVKWLRMHLTAPSASQWKTVLNRMGRSNTELFISSAHRTRSDLSADSSAVPSTWLEARCWSQPKRARDCSSHKPCTQSLPKACEYSETDWLIDNTEVSQSHVNECDMIVSVSSPACYA